MFWAPHKHARRTLEARYGSSEHLSHSHEGDHGAETCAANRAIILCAISHLEIMDQTFVLSLLDRLRRRAVAVVVGADYLVVYLMTGCLETMVDSIVSRAETHQRVPYLIAPRVEPAIQRLAPAVIFSSC
jgi:hypothetical protein